MTERDTQGGASQEAALVAALRRESPGAARLAEVLSFAVLVEPQLMRRARLELLKDARDVDAGSEADLWLSRIVQSRGPDGIVLLPRAAELLRLSLAANPDAGLLERAWKLTAEMHAHLPPTLRLEERINRLTVNPGDDALAEIEAQLQEVVGTLVQEEGREGLANWAARALPRLPEAVRRLEPARVLSMASYLRLGGQLPVEAVVSDPAREDAEGELPAWVAWALPKGLPEYVLGVRLTGDGVEFGPPEPDDHPITLPATNPLIVEVSWAEGGGRRFRQALVRQGERKKVEAPLTDIRLRTILGDRYSITPLPDAAPGRPEHTVMQQDARPECYVTTPFGHKVDPATGRTIDFDAVYHRLIRPGLERAGYKPLRHDDVVPTISIEKPHFERLLFSDCVLADLTTNNANVLYGLGLRHAVRPARTVLIIADDPKFMPSDLHRIQTIVYRLDEMEGAGADRAAAEFAAHLESALKAGPEVVDSPIFHLIEGYNTPDLSRVQSDVLRERQEREEEFRRRLQQARREGVEALRQIEEGLGDAAHASTWALNELLTAYRAAGEWGEMLRLIERMPRRLAETERVEQQRATALARSGRLEEAEAIVSKMTGAAGASHETLAAAGRVYKDLWVRSLNGEQRGGGRYLVRATEAYVRAYEMNLNDPAPGVNALVLMAALPHIDPRREGLLPSVRYAVERHTRGAPADFWDSAMLVELAAVEGDESRARAALDRLMSHGAEPWQIQSVLENIRILRRPGHGTGTNPVVLDMLEKQLEILAH